MANRGYTYASGKNALADCPRCGLPISYSELRRDGQTKEFVCRDCYDPKHPQENVPRDIYDPEALRHPRKNSNVEDETFHPLPGCIIGTAFMGRARGVVS